MPDVTFEALITTGLTILLWHPRPGLWRVAAGALVLGLATDVRQIGELLIMLALPDRSTRRGRRDATLLATLYDTAARVQELADLTVRDLLN